jgi:hypothetical protein
MDRTATIFAVFSGLMTLLLLVGGRISPLAYKIGFIASLAAMAVATILFLAER